MTITHLGHACVLYETARLASSSTPAPCRRSRDCGPHRRAGHPRARRPRRRPRRARPCSRPTPRPCLVCDARTAASFPAATVAHPGDALSLGGVTVSVLGGTHAPVYGDVPDCPNLAYLLDDGALLHPGDSFFVPRPTGADPRGRHRRPLAQALRGGRLREGRTPGDGAAHPRGRAHRRREVRRDARRVQRHTCSRPGLGAAAHRAGVLPVTRLKAVENAASEPYPRRVATAATVRRSSRSMARARCMRIAVT